jgi:hypothetical protein
MAGVAEAVAGSRARGTFAPWSRPWAPRRRSGVFEMRSRTPDAWRRAYEGQPATAGDRAAARLAAMVHAA